MGDFNALSRYSSQGSSSRSPLNLGYYSEDYTAEAWAGIKAKRAASRWEAPATELTDLLRSRDYYDVSLEPSTYQQESDEEDDEDQDEIYTPAWTCWAGTRIDYAWISPSFRQKEVLGSGKKAKLVVAQACTNLSDHRALLLSLPRS